MNFSEAMLHVSNNERAAVVRPGSRFFVWYDRNPARAGGPPMGLYDQAVDGQGGYASRYQPSIEDILANDWEVFDLSLVPRH